tara:strand:+ start:308 stop:682 length:375 start_codon:yes stop_codon:yes gene_type:complete
MKIIAYITIYLWYLLMSKTSTTCLPNKEFGFIHLLLSGIHFMPELNDCTFDLLIEEYAELQANRLHEDPATAFQFIHETLVDRYENMTERELIDNINEWECKETADDLIGTLYGTNPPDCFITD